MRSQKQTPERFQRRDLNKVKFSTQQDLPLFNEYVQRATVEIPLLSDKPEETPEATVAALWHLAADHFVSADAAIELELPHLSDEGQSTLNQAFAERAKGIPLGHLTHRQRFMGIEMLCDPAALIPRKETELIGQLGLKSIEGALSKSESALIIDVCTGSGNLASAFAFNFPKTKVFATDLSFEAVEFAKQNANFIGIADTVEFRAGDLLSPFDSTEFLGNVDVLTCNPPYISSKKLEDMPKEIISYEPELAFNGGAFGISILGKLAKEAPRYLKSGGFLCMEIGLGQGNGVIKMFERTGFFTFLESLSDHNGNIRAIRMVKK